ncbi:hypothetical protein BBOMB_0100 [Bifidobacterium bombi DSM 19703]|uniref:Uncharacterized protein n=1 Tax=Bifidobacterium bombi DSM 19703 TaxID=1341695 RepID=A0A080N5M2_9BIFI|nr:hypothetical protein BBOMB_0100 [Bifidobacterium bombi DSM 19703]
MTLRVRSIVPSLTFHISFHFVIASDMVGAGLERFAFGIVTSATPPYARRTAFSRAAMATSGVGPDLSLPMCLPSIVTVLFATRNTCACRRHAGPASWDRPRRCLA